jgi:phage terminase large subunit-like protein
MLTPSISLVNDYARAVVSGKTLAGDWVVKACQRHLDDLERDDFAFKFDKEKAVKAINFIQLLPHTKGRWAAKGELIHLENWQRFIVGCIFGWVRKSDQLRRFREVYLEIPRKNGKSVLAAGIGLYMLVGDNEYGAEVYSGATTEKQAWEVFRPSRLMALKTPALTSHYNIEVNASNLLRLEDYSRFEPLIGTPGDGASPSCAIVDEFHEHDKPDLFDTMQTGMGAREQPLMFVITTAGSNMAGPCFEKRVEAQKVLKKVFDDERMFAVIYGIDEGDDFKDPDMWGKANPNLGVSVSRDYLEAQVGQAVRSPVKQNSVKTKHFNIWVGAKTAFFNMEHWTAGGDDSLDIKDFADCDGIVGLDLAVRVDIACRVSLFWKEIDSQRHYFAFPHFYLPEEALESAKNGKTYAGWAASGFIELMDGAEISLAQIEEDILQIPNTHSVRELAYDPWQSTQIAQAVREEGIEAVEYRNTVQNMSPPMRELEGALAAGRFHHPDNPVLNWMVSNVVAKEDAKQNVFPRKELPENKIDGVVAVLFALGRAVVMEDNGSMDDFLNNVVSI